MDVHVLQVMPAENYRVYIYFSDGRVKLFDVSHIAGKGVFKKLCDEEFYYKRCTVLNSTLAWDVTGTFDPRNCIDIDPETLYNESVEVKDPLTGVA